MRRVGPSVDKGPMFYLVYTVSAFVSAASPSSWDVRAYWSVGAANRRAESLKSEGRLAFVEAR